MNKKFILTGLLGLVFLGAGSQIIERNLDKEAIKDYVTTHYHEETEQDETINFTEDKENTLLEKLGF